MTTSVLHFSERLEELAQTSVGVAYFVETVSRRVDAGVVNVSQYLGDWHVALERKADELFEEMRGGSILRAEYDAREATRRAQVRALNIITAGGRTSGSLAEARS